MQGHLQHGEGEAMTGGERGRRGRDWAEALPGGRQLFPAGLAGAWGRRNAGAGQGSRRLTRGRGRGGLAAQALHDVSPLDAPQGRQEGVERGTVLADPAGQQGTEAGQASWVKVYVLRLVTQLACQMPQVSPRRAVEQLLYLLPLGQRRAAVQASITLEGCQEPERESDTTTGPLLQWVWGPGIRPRRARHFSSPVWGGPKT